MRLLLRHMQDRRKLLAPTGIFPCSSLRVLFWSTRSIFQLVHPNPPCEFAVYTSASMGGLFRCLFQTPICVSSPLFASTRVAVSRSASMGGGVPLFATTRVIVYRSVSLQLGRAAPLIIQHAVLFLATANYNHNRFLHC